MPLVYSKMSLSPTAISVSSGSLALDLGVDRPIYVSSSPGRPGPSGLSVPGAHTNYSGAETQIDFGNIYAEITKLRQEIAHLKNENALLRGQASGMTYVARLYSSHPVIMTSIQSGVQFTTC